MERKLGINTDCLRGLLDEVSTLKLAHEAGFEVMTTAQIELSKVAELKDNAVRLGVEFPFLHSPYKGINDMWLDCEGGDVMLDELKQKEKLTYLFISHDLSVVRYISDRIGVIYKGNIVEIADAEELFDYPLHPYTRSLISAIPIPDPQLEKNKVLFTYDPSVHDYSEDKPSLQCIGHGHYVFGNAKEIEEYKAIRESGKKVKSITILDPDAPEEEKAALTNVEIIPESSLILERPIHDTGSTWYGIGSFLLPPIGLIAGWIFKKKNYIRNFKMCRKGAIAGLCTLGAVIGLFALALISAVL